jgi:Putative collagen-binding domain of a collagenase
MYWGRFFRSIPWFDLVPDRKHEIVTAGLGEFNGLDYVTAARTGDRRMVVAYMPTARTITVDLSKVAGPTVEVAWMNPRTGTSQAAGQVAATGMRQFTPPGEGDWVFRLDSGGR